MPYYRFLLTESLDISNTQIQGTVPQEGKLALSCFIAEHKPTLIHTYSELSTVCDLREKKLNSEDPFAEFLKADCGPESAPFIVCDCCPVCCDHITGVCCDHITGDC
jgi:hypothetical protein